MIRNQAGMNGAAQLIDALPIAYRDKGEKIRIGLAIGIRRLEQKP